MKCARFVTVELREIRAWGRHGANAGEQDVPQPLDISAHLSVRDDAACESDELSDTVDYAALHARIVEIVETRHFRLLERLGAELLDAVLADERIDMASVSIAKPGLLAGATPAVSVTKVRNGGGTRHKKAKKRKKKREAA